MKKIIRACTVSMSIVFVKGMLPDLTKKYEVVLLSSPGPEMEEAKKEGLARCIAVPMERHISPIKDFVSLCKLIRVFRKERPDMVHSMTPKAGLLCMMAGWLTRVPVRIHTFTGLVFPTSTGLKKRILMLTDALTCRFATHVIPEGEGVKADLLNNGITHKPQRILGYGNVMGIDMQRFSHKNLCNENEKFTQKSQKSRKREFNENGNYNGNVKKTFTFLFVGRIVRDKGMDELMTAFDLLSKKYPQARLVLVGPYEDSLDPVSDETRRIIKDNHAIEAVGTKRGDDLLACYATADCFVFPSYREGFPNTVIEAGAMGLPCIVTDINGSREIITNEKFNENAEKKGHADHADNADCCHTESTESTERYLTTDCTQKSQKAQKNYFTTDRTNDTDFYNEEKRHADCADHADCCHTESTESTERYLTQDCTNFASKREQCQTCLSIAEREQSQDRDSGINTTNFLKTKNKKLKTKTNGIIIPSKDAEALYEAMRMMIEDDAMRESMAKNARPMIESRFEQGFVRKCLYDFYEEVLLS